MPLPRHLPHVLYATALTSFALHLLNTRKLNTERRYQADARTTILEELAVRLRAREEVSDDEIARVRRLAREGVNVQGEQLGVEASERDVDWKTVVLGRVGVGGKEKEEERMKREWEDALRSDSGSQQHSPTS